MHNTWMRRNGGTLATAGFSFALLTLFVLWPQPEARGATAKEIDVSVDVILERFEKEVNGGKEFLKSAKGVLAFPRVLKAGVGFGGEYGEGALRIGGKTVDYYNTLAGSFGFQLGGQVKSILLVFLQEEALTRFRQSEGFKVGVDGSVAVIAIGAGGAVDTTKMKEPIVGFIFDQKGLMYNLTLEGSKFTKLDKK